MSELIERAREIAAFLGIPEAAAIERLSKGFGYQHQQVAADFRRANPQTDEALLEWYRTTEDYIWELSAYHADAGFNYAGMCAGIATALKNHGVFSVICLGDGIGDLSITLRKAGFDVWYHDLMYSRTEDFAMSRYQKLTGEPINITSTPDWTPSLASPVDAIVSLDFLEHVTAVQAWVGEIYRALRPGGLFLAQNAFACGSGPDGSIPMHLARNDRFEFEWDPLLAQLGFVQLSSNWYQKPAHVTVSA